MATLRLYLDTRKTSATGLYTLKVRITVKASNAMIPLDVRISPEQWDVAKQTIKGAKNKDTLNRFVQHQLMDIQDAFLQLKQEGRLKNMTATQIKTAIINKLDGTKTSAPTYIAHYITYIGRIKSKSTLNEYKNTLNKLRGYDSNIDSLTFDDIDRNWVIDFAEHLLKQGLKENSVLVSVKNMRAVWNDARASDITNKYPFFKLHIKPAPTKKRNLSAEALRDIFNGEYDSKTQEYVDMFKLMFMLLGINVTDMHNLTKSDYRNGRIEYIRAKTKRQYSVYVHEEATELIQRYKGKEHLLKIADRLGTVRMKQNMNATLSDIMDNVTTYYARHSWATIASKIGVPKEVISKALGHSEGGVTDIYIEFDMKKVDEANRRVIDYVLYGKE